MPTRVLDVGNGKFSTVHLIEPRPPAMNGPYLILGHCWGQNEVIKLTTTTMDTTHDGISIPELPAHYWDAICRQLEIRYLSIDSLCIIQDRDLDWTRQIAAMGEIHSNALCSIEAAYAADVSGRLFFSRNKTSITPFPVTAEWHQEGPLTFFLIDLSV